MVSIGRYLCILIACVSFSCTEKSPKEIPFVAEESEKASELAPVSKDSFRPKLDILFVIDDSGSMSTHQMNLANNIDRFADAIVRTKFLDYHVGVVTSTVTSFSSFGKCCGKLVGSPTFVDRNTPNGLNVLAKNLIVGTSGDYQEKFFDPVFLALTTPNLTGHNKDFYRTDANLALIFITDTEDQSDRIDGRGLYDFLLNLKGSADKIFVAAAHIPEAEIEICSGETMELEDSDALNDFFQITKASTFSLCDNFGDKLAEIGVKIASKSQTMYLNKIPKKGTIKVTMGGVPMPEDVKKGWSYNPSKVAIEFGAGIEWDLYPDNTFPQIDFEVLELETDDKK
jgi:hypothetical protein